MATAQLNPIVTAISGSIGKLVFYKRYDKTVIRTYIIPPNPNTPAQSKNRSRFRNAMLSWQSLPVHDKARYNLKARKLGMTGHNLYISRYMKAGAAGENDNRGCGETFNPQVALSKPPSPVYEACRSVTAPSMFRLLLYSGSLPRHPALSSLT